MWLGSRVAVAVVEVGSYSSDLTPGLVTSVVGVVLKDKYLSVYAEETFPQSFFFFFFFFLGPHPQHMEVLRLGVKSKLQLLAYASAITMWYLNCICDLHHSSRQCRILNPLNEARD